MHKYYQWNREGSYHTFKKGAIRSFLKKLPATRATGYKVSVSESDKALRGTEGIEQGMDGPENQICVSNKYILIARHKHRHI